MNLQLSNKSMNVLQKTSKFLKGAENLRKYIEKALDAVSNPLRYNEYYSKLDILSISESVKAPNKIMIDAAPEKNNGNNSEHQYLDTNYRINQKNYFPKKPKVVAPKFIGDEHSLIKMFKPRKLPIKIEDNLIKSNNKELRKDIDRLLFLKKIAYKIQSKGNNVPPHLISEISKLEHELDVPKSSAFNEKINMGGIQDSRKKSNSLPFDQSNITENKNQRYAVEIGFANENDNYLELAKNRLKKYNQEQNELINEDLNKVAETAKQDISFCKKIIPELHSLNKNDEINSILQHYKNKSSLTLNDRLLFSRYSLSINNLNLAELFCLPASIKHPDSLEALGLLAYIYKATGNTSLFDNIINKICKVSGVSDKNGIDKHIENGWIITNIEITNITEEKKGNQIITTTHYRINYINLGKDR